MRGFIGGFVSEFAKFIVGLIVAVLFAVVAVLLRSRIVGRDRETDLGTRRDLS